MIKEEFDKLCEQWRDETNYLSNHTTALKHLAAQKIIEAGTQVLPWVFNRIMFDDRSWWCLFASEITGLHPFPEVAQGRIYLINAYWLIWGVDNGYITNDSINNKGCKTNAGYYWAKLMGKE